MFLMIEKYFNKSVILLYSKSSFILFKYLYFYLLILLLSVKMKVFIFKTITSSI